MKYVLKTTGEVVQELNWIAQTPQPWPAAYVRVMMPKGGVQVIRKDKLKVMEAEKGLGN